MFYLLRKRIVLVLAFLLVIPFVSGLSFPSLISTYNQFYGWLDFLIFFLIFFSLPKIVFKKHFEGEESGAFNALCLGIGLVLSFAMLGLEYYFGVNIFSFGPLAILVLVLAVLLPLIGLFKKEGEGGSNRWLAFLIILLIILLAVWFFYPELLTYIPYGDDLWWILIVIIGLILLLLLLKGVSKHVKWPEWSRKEKRPDYSKEGLSPYDGSSAGVEREPFKHGDLVDNKTGQPNKEDKVLGYSKLKIKIEFKPSKRIFGDTEDFVVVSNVNGGSGDYVYQWSLPGLAGVISDKPYVQLSGRNFPLPSGKDKIEYAIELVVRDNTTGNLVKAVSRFKIKRMDIFTKEKIGIVVQDMIDGRSLQEGSKFIQLRDPIFVASNGGDLLISAVISGGYVVGEHDIVWDVGVPLGVRTKAESFIFNSGDWGFGKGFFTGKQKNEETKTIGLKVRYKGKLVEKAFNLVLLKREHEDHVKIKIDKPISQDFAIGEQIELLARVERDDYSVVEKIVWYYMFGGLKGFNKKSSRPIMVSNVVLETDSGVSQTVVLPVIKEGSYVIYAVAKGTGGIIDSDYDRVLVNFFTNKLEIIKPKNLSRHFNHNILDLECDFRDFTGRIQFLQWVLFDSTGNNVMKDNNGNPMVVMDDLLKISGKQGLKVAIPKQLDISDLDSEVYVVALFALNSSNDIFDQKRVRIRVEKPQNPVLKIVEPEVRKRITQGYVPGESLKYRIKLTDPDKICSPSLFEWEIYDINGMRIPIKLSSVKGGTFVIPKTMPFGNYTLMVSAVNVRVKSSFKGYYTGEIDRKDLLPFKDKVDFVVKNRLVKIRRIIWPNP